MNAVKPQSLITMRNYIIYIYIYIIFFFNVHKGRGKPDNEAMVLKSDKNGAISFL